MSATCVRTRKFSAFVIYAQHSILLFEISILASAHQIDSTEICGPNRRERVALYCAAHRRAGDVDLHHRRCGHGLGCPRLPTYGDPAGGCAARRRRREVQGGDVQGCGRCAAWPHPSPDTIPAELSGSRRLPAGTGDRVHAFFRRRCCQPELEGIKGTGGS